MIRKVWNVSSVVDDSLSAQGWWWDSFLWLLLRWADTTDHHRCTSFCRLRNDRALLDLRWRATRTDEKTILPCVSGVKNSLPARMTRKANNLLSHTHTSLSLQPRPDGNRTGSPPSRLENAHDGCGEASKKIRIELFPFCQISHPSKWRTPSTLNFRCPRC